MHALIESLPPRQHLSATLDPSFGTNGVAKPGYFPARTLAAGDAVFVESTTSANPAIQKLTNAGVLDTTWGNKGVVVLPFETFDTWAYDTRLNRLVVAGRARDDNVTVAKVLRLDAAGKPDAAFGDNGVYTYTPPLPSASNSPDFDGVSTSATVENLTPLLHGELLVGVRRDLTTYFSTSGTELPLFTSQDNTNIDVSLLKLRRNGTRQLAFGRRGLRPVLTGTQQVFNDDGERSTNTTAPHLVAATRDADGGVTVTLTKTLNNTDYSGVFAFRLDVMRRRVDSAGTIDATADAEWKLAQDDATADKAATTFQPLLVQPTETGVRVIGRPVTGTTAGAAAAYDLEPGQAPLPKSVKLTPGGVTLVSVTPTRRGYFAVGQVNRASGGYQQYAILLNPRLRPIASWGDGGAVKVPVGDVIFDPDGRILLAGSGQVARYRVDAK